VDDLRDDLLLLETRSDQVLALPDKLRFALSGAELVQLAAAGRVGVVRRRLVILDAAPTGDPLLDDALNSMPGQWRLPSAEAWVQRNRRGLVTRYLERAQAAGIVCAEPGAGFLGKTRWRVVDTSRAAQACARLQEIAASTGPVSQEQAALAGLASATGLDRAVFPGLSGGAARKRLRKAAASEPLPADAARATGAAADAARHAAVNAALLAASAAAAAATAAAAGAA
jgi:hypothetical protein